MNSISVFLNLSNKLLVIMRNESDLTGILSQNSQHQADKNYVVAHSENAPLALFLRIRPSAFSLTIVAIILPLTRLPLLGAGFPAWCTFH